MNSQDELRSKLYENDTHLAYDNSARAISVHQITSSLLIELL